jgi:hypothetical protein
MLWACVALCMAGGGMVPEGVCSCCLAPHMLYVHLVLAAKGHAPLGGGGHGMGPNLPSPVWRCSVGPAAQQRW